MSSKLNQSGYIFFDLLLFVVVCGVIFGVVKVFDRVLLNQSSAITEIRSGIAGYCLDDYRNHLTPNATVDSWSCNGTISQVWTAGNNTISHDKNYCLDIDSGSTTPGTKIVLNRCNGSPSQVWISAVDGYENPASALCLAVPSNQTGQQLVAASCDNLTAANEAWAPSTWAKNNTAGAPTACSGSEGQLVACYAAKQWMIWQSGSTDHNTLLNNYSDGNGYEEWCADFVSYVYKQAGYAFTAGERDGWDEYLADNVQNMGLTYHDAASYTPQPGDIAYFNYSGGHVEVVVVGGAKPIFIYGDSGTTDPSTGNGEMTENTLTAKAGEGQLVYYLSPN